MNLEEFDTCADCGKRLRQKIVAEDRGGRSWRKIVAEDRKPLRPIRATEQTLKYKLEVRIRPTENQ